MESRSIDSIQGYLRQFALYQIPLFYFKNRSTENGAAAARRLFEAAASWINISTVVCRMPSIYLSKSKNSMCSNTAPQSHRTFNQQNDQRGVRVTVPEWYCSGPPCSWPQDCTALSRQIVYTICTFGILCYLKSLYYNYPSIYNLYYYKLFV